LKLLLDENLSPRLVPAISALFPNSKHVLDCGLEGASGTVIWQYALDQGFAIVSSASRLYSASVKRTGTLFPFA
jgi:predicted nuclease of predicted toxin-antitoxin system